MPSPAPRDLDIARLVSFASDGSVSNARLYLLCSKTEEARGHPDAALAHLDKAREIAEKIVSESLGASRVGFTGPGTTLRLLCEVACAEARLGRLDAAIELVHEIRQHTVIYVHGIQAGIYVGGALTHSSRPSPTTYPAFWKAAPNDRAALLIGADSCEGYDVYRDDGEIEFVYVQFAQHPMTVSLLPKLNGVSPARRRLVAGIVRNCSPTVGCRMMIRLATNDADPRIRQMAAAALGFVREQFQRSLGRPAKSDW